ncbi:MAG: hypothetical protein ACXAEF_01980 [Candidatus Thorarchaeota archaeon]|jgi:hypothetical protein
MLGQTADEVISKEIESVRARRIILDQLEGGPKTGTELRESIRKDMAATLIGKKGKRSAKEKKVVVTDPKLYHNTGHLEKLGIISSRRESRERVFELCPQAYHPVRRALKEMGLMGANRPIAYVTSIPQPDDQRPFVLWLSKARKYSPRKLMLFTEARIWKRQKLRSIERFVAEGAKSRWDTITQWYDIPEEITGEQEETQHGNLQAVYEFIRDEISEIIPTHDVVVDLSMGTPLTILAMVRLIEEYSLTAIHVENYEDEKARVLQYYPRGNGSESW